MSRQETERKSTIKAVARKLFKQYGFRKTSLDDIARIAGVTKTTLYHYYPNKEAIFDDIVYEDALDIFNRIDANLDASLPADKKFIQFGRLLLKELQAHAEELKHVPENLIEYSPHGRPIIEKIKLIFRQRLESILQEGIAQGIFQSPNVQITLDALVAMGDFIRMPWLIDNPPEYCQQVFEEFQRLVLDGLRRREK